MTLAAAPSTPLQADRLTLAVFAPFGDDMDLSRFPDGADMEVRQHPLVQALSQVAAHGVAVLALLDRCGEDSLLIDIPPGNPADLKFNSLWKQDMVASAALAGLLIKAHQRYPDRQLMLSIEGHGAGYVPSVDVAGLLASSTQAAGNIHWQVSQVDAAPFDADGQPVVPAGFPTLPAGFPTLPAGFPTLPAGFPTMPAGFPTLPAGFPTLPLQHAVLPTFSLGEALRKARDAGCPPLAVLHFANCFNMSVEVLHTVAPYAQAAAGYCNYNFFTAGGSYAAVFARLSGAGEATADELASWFVAENHALLAARGRHPIVGGSLALSRMAGIAEAVDELSDALLQVMRAPATPAGRSAVRAQIQDAIAEAQQYDTSADMVLETPDQLTDLCSLAAAMERRLIGQPAVQAAAATLVQRLQNIKQVGDVDAPWMDESDTAIWNFAEPTLAMNIFLPDPVRTGQWDWRTPFYVDLNPGQGPARLQTGVIDFLKETNWVEFLVEYHSETPFHAMQLPRPSRAPMASTSVRPLSKARLAEACAKPKTPRSGAPLGPIAQKVKRMKAGN